MGFQDRGYSRREAGFSAGDWSAVWTIIVINVAVWLANFVVTGDLLRGLVPLRFCPNDFFSLEWDVLRHPWRLYELVSYGFIHDGPSLELQERLQAVGRSQEFSPFHLVFNMLTLWFFGREVEAVTGKAEFIRFYLTAIVVAGLAWLTAEQINGQPARLMGASGGVMAVLAVFIWYYPRMTVLIWGVLPVPAWALGVLYFFSDLRGAATDTGNVAHVAHLAGAVFGALYAWRGWSLGGLAGFVTKLRSRRPSLRVLRPEAAEDDGGLDAAVDRILEKISRTGESSLTAAERETLARASRRLKDRSR